MTKKELIELVEQICNSKLPDELGSKYIDILEANVPHPAPSDLIFWDFRDLTPEEIVEIALNYKEEEEK
ncbi:bacteriocin immunity protein [Bacillus cereus group sp. BfR-BA-01380]|uniref:bacteriocin immunity protein n=1 Tax=Bacillus cereus group sp. BfR-BA-01380 TaxID=2920324 RepID=UPI001F5A02AE|nr:bacteriocin immunity protein [Bacillus cereus group sp. BfR-BA-01380]